MGSKKQSEIVHARRRALMRYGLNCGPRTRENLVRIIREGEGIFLSKKSNRVSAFAVFYENVWYPVVYDRNRKEIVTFLPAKYLDRYRDRLY